MDEVSLHPSQMNDELEAGTQVKLEPAWSKLIGGLPESSVCHIRVHGNQVTSIEQVKDFSFGFDLHPLAEEEWQRKGLFECEVEVVVTGLVVGVAA